MTTSPTEPIALRRRPAPYFSARSPRWRQWLAHCVAAGNRTLDRLPPARAWYARQLRKQLEWTRLELPTPTAPRLRIAFLSDLHAGSFLREADLTWLFERVTAERPDVVLLGGDLINTRAREIEMFEAPLRALRPRLGVYAVPGNHERFANMSLDPWRERLEAFGVTVLLNRGVRLEDDARSLWLGGVDDWTEGDPDLDAALAGRRTDEPTVLLSHHPDLLSHASTSAVDLMLSGHTHGGQVAPFGVILMKHSDAGLHRGAYEHGPTRLHVGRGIGAAILPIRVGARPEVVLVDVGAPRA